MKTTMQDLIVGHYEGALTPGQENELQALLATSPEARTMYEQHGAMEEVMEEESERLIPPIALREATIGAALGIAAESIGGGIAAWFTTKVAIAIGSVVVGGTAIGIVLSTTGDDTPENSLPAASAPAAVGTVEGAAAGDASSNVVGTDDVANDTEGGQSSARSTERANSAGSRVSGRESNMNTTGSNVRDQRNNPSPYTLDDSDGAVIDGETTIKPQPKDQR